jgi:AcrR family transcriptional regulator
MGKSLTNLAKQIISESNDPTPDRDAKKMTPNAATLRPGSRGAEGRVVNPGSTPPVGGVQDLGSAPIAPGEGENFGAKAASGQKKDTTIKGSTGPAEKSKQQAEYMEEETMTLEEAIEAYVSELAEQGLDEDSILEAVHAEFGDYLEEDTDEADYQVDMSEHVEALFAGEQLSEEFKQKAVTIFEAAVKQKLEEEIANIEEAYDELFEEEVQKIHEQLSENVDDYLNYVVENWVTENQLAVETGLRTELTEEFITGLRQLFAEHYIDIPEEKVSVVEEMSAKVAELESKLNEEFERNVVLSKKLNESTQNDILAYACDGLTDTQAEKLKALAEGINFASADEYSNKINILRESYFNGSVKSDNVLDNNEVDGDGRGMISEELKGPMAAYVRTLGRKLPN